MSIHFSSLTSKQKKVYAAIEAYIKLKGIPPTVREIGEIVGEKTPGSVQGILNRLEQKGVIKRQTGMARSIRLVSEGDVMYANPVYIPEIKRINARNVDNLLTIYNINKYHPLSSDLVQSKEGYFLVKCPSLDLPKSGIKDGDLLLINMNGELKDGDIVLAFYGNRACLRHYYTCDSQNAVILKADESVGNKEVLDKDYIKIIGKLDLKFSRY